MMSPIFFGVLLSSITLSISHEEDHLNFEKRQAGCPPGCNPACAPACNPDCCTSARGVSAAFLQAAASALCPPQCVPVPPTATPYFYGGAQGMCPQGCAPAPPPPSMQIDTPSPAAALQAANVAAKALQGLLNTAYNGICPPICQQQCSGCSPACCAALLAKCAQGQGMPGCH